MSKLETNIVIIGGGLIGMTLALGLAKLGLNICLFDQQSLNQTLDQDYDGRCSTIAYGSKLILDHFGIWTSLEPFAQPIVDIRVSDGHINGKTSSYLHYALQDLDPSSVPALGYVIDNQILRHNLWVLIQQYANISCFSPAKPIIAGREENFVLLDWDQKIKTKLVIAADGKKSSTRDAAGIKIYEYFYSQSAIVTTIEHIYPHHGIAFEHFMPAGPFAVLPLLPKNQKNYSSIVWSDQRIKAEEMMKLNPENFSRAIEQRFPWLGSIKAYGKRWIYPLSFLKAEQYIDHRLVVIGDAAHSIHPIAGQGLNLGLRDIECLVKTIDEALKLGLDYGDINILSHYQKLRRQDVMLLSLMTDGLNKLFSTNNPLIRYARDIGLTLVHHNKPVKKLLMKHAMGLTQRTPVIFY
ncbi:MAG: FAD-dependent monooxygenase [Alphaproteobacteria bacterium]|nr:FAD-dependent monooxygenase [Alphaproteobacteria bacterium]